MDEMKPKQNEKSRKVEGWNGDSKKNRKKRKKKGDPTNWNTRVTMDENVGNFGWEINYVWKTLLYALEC